VERKYFGTDGIRGLVGEFPITPDFVLRLGHAAGRVLAAEHGAGRAEVLVGKDTRVSGYMLEAALEAGFASAGVGVVLCGPLPTPAVAYLTRAQRLAAGVVISASHNPYGDNGIKFFSGSGRKLADQTEERIERAIDEPLRCVASAELGKARRLDDAGGRYIEFCKSTFPADTDLRGMRILVDCAHGAAYQVAPAVLHELGAEVISVGASPNGFNINEGVGAVHAQALGARVLEHGADIGIALDGDADRVILCDAAGRVFQGDELLYVIVRDRMRSSKVEGVVGTLMTNHALEHRFGELGIPFVRARVGDRYVLEQLEQRGWLYGGEGSGHLLCLDRHTTGDGIVSALQVLAALRRSGSSLAELTADLPLMAQDLVNVRVPAGFDWKTHAALSSETARVQGELGEEGRVLIRPSGTEPLLRVMVEARDGAVARAMARRLVATLPTA
jgi:phosphoglucosamine mutase